MLYYCNAQTDGIEFADQRTSRLLVINIKAIKLPSRLCKVLFSKLLVKALFSFSPTESLEHFTDALQECIIHGNAV